MALKHKGLDFNEVKLNFRQLNKTILELTDGKWKQVPALKFEDGSVYYNSRDIAIELEKRFPENPKLFPNGSKLAEFLEKYIEANIDIIGGLCIEAERDVLLKEDQDLQKDLFDIGIKMFSRPIEGLYVDFERLLKPLILMLKDTPFFEGTEPTYSDYIVFSLLQSIRVLTPVHFEVCVQNIEDKTLINWFEKLSNLFDGYAKAFPINLKHGPYALKN
ncbi:hypothetical protein K502DRAFT_316443 [Neoconidiobolus thromboides FSU 785]|nr:hypothetical protein K502DRAFT_316443 [Neoconidiobolus thromboides FSU 785]